MRKKKLNMNDKELSLIIPCYNEEENLHSIFEKLKEIINENKDIEIILVNNGSTDNSLRVMNSLIEESLRNNIILVNVENNLGYGHGISSGLRVATANILSWTHADMQTDPKDILKALHLFKTKEKCIVKGNRKNRNIIDFFFTLSMQIIVFIILKIYITDINAQPKLFSREFYDNYLDNKSPNDFSLDLYLLLVAKKNNYKILEFPVIFADRTRGVAKGGGSMKTKFKLIHRTLKYIWNIRKII